MSQPLASGSMSQTPAATPPSSNIEGIFETALKSYKKKTKHDLKKHDLFKQFEKCNSPGDILAAFQTDQFGPSWIGDASKKWFVPTVNVLYAFSAALGEGVGLVFSPAKVVFAGVGVLLLAAKDVAASQDILIDIFGRIGGFFGRLEIYTGVPLIPAMKNKMVEITVEVLNILATATKEMGQSRTRKFVKRVAGRTDLEDGMKKLDTLTLEEVVMASAVHLSDGNVIKNMVADIAGGVRGVEKNGEEVIATTMEAKLIVQQTADNVDDMKLKQLRESVRKWQSPPDPSTSHNFASDRQHEGTAKWLLEDDKFGKWKVTGSLLWIHGKPGSGKSVLCSAIINDITTLCKDGSASMAYFYFDFRETDKQSRSDLLSSLLAQLSHRSDDFCDALSLLYKEHDNGARQPSDSASMQCLTDMLTLPDQGPIYLIMDALDECPIATGFPSARKQVLDLVKDLVRLRLPNLHIVVTSRPEVDIADVLRPLTPHEISLHDERGQQKDIADFVKSVVNSDSGAVMKRWRKADKELVVETLSKKADGMFRWVFCQLEMLQNCIPQNIRRVLSELPKSLDETYERMLKEIGKANPHEAHRLLQCLTVATRPLRVDELAEVLALDFDEAEDKIPALNKDWRWGDQQQGVLSTCSSLVVVVDGYDDNFRKCRIVQFAHFSVKEFLTSDRLADLKTDFSYFHIRPKPAHTVITQACLAALIRSDYDDRGKSSSPLSGYAARYWVGHALFEGVSLRVEDGMRRLFDPARPYFAAWLNSYDIDNRWASFQPRGSGAKSGRALLLEPTLSEPLCLYYASLCGFLDLSKYLIDKYPRHVNARVGFNKSPLVAALLNRHWQVAELLYQNHADVNVTGYKNRTPLHAGSKDGIVDVAQWLLDHGADANSQDNDCTTPLHLATMNGHLELVRMLLGYNADVNARNRNRSTPFHVAVSFRKTQIMQLLIKHGADVNALDRNHSTSLHVVSFTGSAESVRLLIELGADVNVRDGNHKTALHLALSPYDSRWMLLSDQRVMQLLIQNGADVNAQDGDHLTPLHLASSRENTEIVQLLIEHGADVDALDRSYSKPVRTIGPLPADNRSPRTNTVAILSEQLKSLDPPGPAPLLSHYLTHSDRFGNVSSSGSATTTEFETSISEIFKMVERFRILVVGRSGVGKSSLINCAFGINDAIVFPDRPGKSDIEQEFVSPENQYLVLHDSQGFEPGDLSNFETVRTFIEQRSQQHLPLRDRIHGLWLCVETPTAGGRVFEKGDEDLLKYAHEIQIPVVLVFTKYDRLVKRTARLLWSKKAKLQEEHEDMDEISLCNQSEKDATIAFKECLQSLQRMLGRLNIPMPHCARVSVRNGYQEDVSTLVERTRDVVRDRLGVVLG